MVEVRGGILLKRADAIEPLSAAMEQQRGQQTGRAAVAVPVGMDGGELMARHRASG